MKNSKIFLVGSRDDELLTMIEKPYENEDILQVLLEKYPDLLAGDQITPENPRKWILVKREMGIPSQAEGSNTWSIDHLFIDQDAIPTFVECNLSSDTRIRREVVAQMLDYAANGTEYWSIDKIRQEASVTALEAELSLDDQVLELVEGESSEEIANFWGKVEINLRSGRIRLVFVADEIPKELRRLVEFLNLKMIDTEVLAIEVKQFLGTDGLKAIVPRVLGITEAVRQGKSTLLGTKKRTDKEEFLKSCDTTSRKFLKEMLSNIEKDYDYTIYWGEKGFSVRTPRFSKGKGLTTFLYGYPPNRFEIYLGYLNLDEQNDKKMRKQLKEFGIFKESGKHTIRALIQENHIKVLEETFSYIVNFIEELSEIKTNG